MLMSWARSSSQLWLTAFSSILKVNLAQQSPRSDRLGGYENSTPSPLRQKFVQFLTLRDLADRTVHSYTAYLLGLRQLEDEQALRFAQDEAANERISRSE